MSFVVFVLKAFRGGRYCKVTEYSVGGKIRNPKHETNSNERNGKSKTTTIRTFEIRVSDLSRISIVGFRILFVNELLSIKTVVCSVTILYS